MTSRLPSNLTYFQETTNSNRDITETYSISQVFHILLIATPNKLSRLQGQTHRDELGDLVLLINKKQWEVNWKLASGHKKKKKEGWTMGHFAAVEHSDMWRDRGEKWDESKGHNLNWSLRVFLCSQGLFVKAAFRVTGLARGTSAVNGNYKTGKVCNLP